jgi:hypothetical protein
MRNLPIATWILAAVVLAGVLGLTACNGGSSSASTSTSTSTGTPGISLSTTGPVSFTSAVGTASAAQTVTITNSGTAELTFSGFQPSPSSFAQTNTCGTGIAAGGSCTVSITYTPAGTTTVSGTLTITDNASGSPQTVTLSGTGTSTSVSPTSLTFSPTSTSLPVTLSNVSSSAVAVTSIAVTAGSSNFSETNNCPASLLGGANCTITVTFTPPASGTVTGTLTIVDAAGTFTVSLNGSATALNTAQVSVNFGPNGYMGPPTPTSGSYYNGIFTTVTVCQPGSTTNCTTIPNVLVDTGSVGLRVLSSGLAGVTTQVSSLSLPQVNDPSTGDPVYECIQFGDLSYTWGTVQLATVQVGGETASQVPGGTANAGIPIQVIAAGSTPPSEIGVVGSTGEYDNPCLFYPGTTTATGGVNDDTVTSLGSNGILGIGNETVDCNLDGTNYCNVSGAINTTGQYLICSSVGSSTCDAQSIPLQDQVWNPVSAFGTDSNGVVLNLPSVPAAGEASVNGTLIFGIGTQSNNALTTQKVYERDSDGNFSSAVLNGVTYNSTNSGGTFLDSGSNGLYIADQTTLGTSDCYVGDITPEDDIGYYCPSSPPLTPSLTLTGSNGTSSSPTLSIGNALSLFSANTSYAVFSNLGGPSCVATSTSPCSSETDFIDLGLPFFFGSPIYVGIAGATSGTPDYANGYWAF